MSGSLVRGVTTLRYQVSMEWTPLASRARVYFHLKAAVRLVFFWAPACVMGAMMLGIWVSPSVGVGVSAGWFVVMFLTAVWYPTWSFERWGYALRDGDLLVAHGVLFREVNAIPTSRIQHVDTRQGPVEQWLGLARIQVYTASGMGADGVIPGLLLHDAEELRDHLVRARGDDGV